MAVKVKNILDILNREAPFHLAEPWDNVGLLVGNSEQEVTAVLAGLDPTNDLVDEALALGANTIITHHPVIFKPLATINTNNPSGRLLEKALSHQISIIGCHTNFDSAQEGVSDYLATQLGIKNLTPLAPTQDGDLSTGIGRIGNYLPAIGGSEFLDRVLKVLKLSAIQTAGKVPATISSVAVCGGSGSDFAEAALTKGADIYLSAEIKHSTAIWAIENDFCIMDGTHYATEKPAVTLLIEKLIEAGKKEGWTIDILPSQREHAPFVLADKNYQP